MASFEIENKVAIVTGGASGIGLEYVKELLRNGARGVTFADINETAGTDALQKLTLEFGVNKTHFVKADVCCKKQFEEIFKQTVTTFKNVDILINNAGILNDSIWEKQIQINLYGTIYGTLLALEEYIPKYKTAEEGLIVNVSSIAALEPTPFIPIYNATKVGVLGLSTSFGAAEHYDRTKIRVLAICPGVTDTPLIQNMCNGTLGEEYTKILLKGIEGNDVSKVKNQTPEQMAKSLIKVIKRGKSGSVWVAEFGDDPYEVEYLNRQKMTKVPA